RYPFTLYSNIKAWISRVAMNAAYDVLRKNKKYCQEYEDENVIYEESVSTYETHEESTEVIVEKLIQNETLYAAMAKLTDAERTLVFLRYNESMSYHDIATVLGISEQALGKRLERVKKKLGSNFVQEWGEPD